MIERIMSIADREANKAEKAKAWIILVFLFIPAAAGYWVVIRWINWQKTTRFGILKRMNIVFMYF